MKLKKGQILYIDNKKYIVKNMIDFSETKEENWVWQEYEIEDELNNHKWLSVEEIENNKVEYYLFDKYKKDVDINELQFTDGEKQYELYEKGFATVKDYFGNADVDKYETCEYFDYMSNVDKTIISVEKWQDEKSASIGKKIDETRIRITQEMEEQAKQTKSYQKNFTNTKNKNKNKFFTIILAAIIFIPLLVSMFSGIFVNKSIEKYIDKSNNYTYVTSVTNNTNRKKAKVYRSSLTTIDAVTKDIIDGVPEGIEKTTSSKDEATGQVDGVGLQSDDEFAYIYQEANQIYVQVSSKQYLNNSGTMYHSRHYYHYYNTYRTNTEDSTYASYAYSAKQRSVNSRTSSGGGTSYGK